MELPRPGLRMSRRVWFFWRGIDYGCLLQPLRDWVTGERAVLLKLRRGDSGGAPLAMPGRPLVRPIVGRKIAGVCIGLAQAYNWDVALVRVFAVIGFFFSGGLVFVAYLAGWVGIPSEEYPAVI